MRSRMVREGSVGLFIILGLIVFGSLILWLRGFTIGKRSYKTVIEFPNIAGMQVGSSVRYRGVTVGKISDISPSTNGVDVTVEITSPNLVIPRDGLLVETNQSGIIGETYIDMKPLKPLPPDVQGLKPVGSSCNTDLIVCDNSRLQGQVGPSIDELLRSTTRLANLYTDPKLYANLNALTQNTSVAAAGVTQLTRDLSGLTRSAQQELGNFSGSVNSVTRSVNQTAYQAGLAANQLNKTAAQAGFVVSQFSNTANQYNLSGQQLNQLLGNMNTLVQRNRSTLETTLVNFNQASRQVVGTVDTLKSTLAQVNSTVGRFNSTKLVTNLEVLSGNAAKASTDAAQAATNLRNLTTGLNTLNTRENLVQLQRTLDSAQAVFENARKITSDLDELTGDPAFRNNVRNLVNGLGKLVSSTQQLEQQVQVANALAPISEQINTTVPTQVTVSRPFFSSRSLFSKDNVTQTPAPVPSPTSQLVPATDKTAPRQLPASKEKQLKPLPQSPASFAGEEWFVPDDQPESQE